MFYKSTFLFILSCLFSIHVAAVEYPAEIQGVWANAPEYCPQIEITKKYAIFGTEQTCEIISSKASNNKFLIKEKCSGEGGSSTSTRTSLLAKEALSISFGQSSINHQRCGVDKNTSTAPGIDKVDAKIVCKVNEGQAGVTTFLDIKLKKQGSSIRDFDGYEFKLEKKIKVEKSEVLEGALIRNDGSVAEKKSYAFAEEWTCK